MKMLNTPLNELSPQSSFKKEASKESFCSQNLGEKNQTYLIEKLRQKVTGRECVDWNWKNSYIWNE